MTDDNTKRNDAKLDLISRMFTRLQEIARQVRKGHSSQVSRTSELAGMVVCRLMGERSELTAENYLRHFVVAAKHVLQDEWRRKNTLKRGRRWTRVSHSEAFANAEDEACFELAQRLDEALKVLQSESSEAAIVLRLKCAGLTEPQIAKSLNLSVGSVTHLNRVAISFIRELFERTTR
ncbi:MAG: hypothetical protein IT434_10035 [Phycisphaerales bacterium]|nr:hypothetical protein [Phycisphaerales bacterium]